MRRTSYGLRVARVTYSWGDNDKALIQHALGQMQTSLEAVGATDIFRQEDDTNHLAGTARMGDDPATSVVNCGLPQLGHSQSVGLRRLDLSDDRRRKPVADDHQHRDADGGSHPGAGRTRGAVGDHGGDA